MYRTVRQWKMLYGFIQIDQELQVKNRLLQTMVWCLSVWDQVNTLTVSDIPKVRELF